MAFNRELHLAKHYQKIFNNESVHVFVFVSVSHCVRGYLYVHISCCDSVGAEILDHKSSFPGRNVEHGGTN